MLSRKPPARTPRPIRGDGYRVEFKDTFKKMFNFKKERDGYAKWFAANMASGGMAGAAIFGLVDSQTQTPSKSPASVTNPVLNYGETE